MVLAPADTGENKGGRSTGRPAGTARLIRLLVALAGGDPRQCRLPPLKRSLHLTVQTGAAPEVRWIAVAPVDRLVAGNWVYVAGRVTAVAGATVQVDTGGALVGVTLGDAGDMPVVGQWLSACGTVQGAELVMEHWEVQDVQ